MGEGELVGVFFLISVVLIGVQWVAHCGLHLHFSSGSLSLSALRLAVLISTSACYFLNVKKETDRLLPLFLELPRKSGFACFLIQLAGYRIFLHCPGWLQESDSL